MLDTIILPSEPSKHLTFSIVKIGMISALRSTVSTGESPSQISVAVVVDSVKKSSPVPEPSQSTVTSFVPFPLTTFPVCDLPIVIRSGCYRSRIGLCSAKIRKADSIRGPRGIGGSSLTFTLTGRSVTISQMIEELAFNRNKGVGIRWSPIYKDTGCALTTCNWPHLLLSIDIYDLVGPVAV